MNKEVNKYGVVVEQSCKG